MDTFSDMDSALAFVASAEFYAEWTAVRLPDGTYGCIRDYDILPDEIEWTYCQGLSYWVQGRDASVMEDSGLFEPCETWSGRPFAAASTAGYVRRALPGACEALESGRAVTFGLEVVYASDPATYCECDGGYASDSCECESGDCQCDRLIGWCALAYMHDGGDTALYLEQLADA